MFQLIVDTREQAVRPHLDILFNESTDPIIKKFKYNILQINVGDFIITYEGKAICCIERKTLADFGASLTDQRYTVNTKKMIDYRTTTGCKLIYIVEHSNAFPSSSTCFSRIPYEYIQAAMDKLILQDDIHVIKTKNAEHTLIRIINLMKQYNSIYKKIGILNDPILYLMSDQPQTEDANINIDIDIASMKIDTESNDAEVAGASESIEPLNKDELAEITAILTKREPRTTEYNAIELWSSIHAISSTTARNILTKCSMIEYLQNPGAYMLTTESGRVVSKTALTSLNSLRNGDIPIMTKCLASIDGISADTANQIVNDMKCNFTEYSVVKLEGIKIKQKTRTISFSNAKANKIMDTLLFKIIN